MASTAASVRQAATNVLTRRRVGSGRPALTCGDLFSHRRFKAIGAMTSELKYKSAVELMESSQSLAFGPIF
jgi:hypothetical protein